jgi:hypothetical protein
VGSLATIVESDLVDDLARPAAEVDWDWVRPGRVAWSWWSDSASPASLERQRDYVDFAARAGWEYVLVDEGWSPGWVPELVAYAAERGVGVLLWSRWDALRTAEQRRTAFSSWRAWGVAGVKVDFMHSDSPGRLAWYRALARDAAAQRLVVDFHGSTAPRGLSRTFPNVLTMEAVQGAESYKSDMPLPATPAHNATLPFTRNAIGPMDYTPVTFSAVRRKTSAAHELALSVVFASGLQHFADSPESYAALPLAEWWLREVPAAWDETRLLDGYPGVAATIARRAGASWFVGGVRAGAGGQVDLPLGFLPPGRTYTAWVIGDAPAGGLAARRTRVSARDTLRLATGVDGGFVVRLSPVRPAQPGGGPSARGASTVAEPEQRAPTGRKHPKRSIRQPELTPRDIEHDGLAIPCGDRQRHVRIPRREGRGRDGASSEGARERKHGIGQHLHGAERGRQLAGLRIGADGARGHCAEIRQRQRGAAHPRVDLPHRVAFRHLEPTPGALDEHRSRVVPPVEHRHDALCARAGGEVLDRRDGLGKPAHPRGVCRACGRRPTGSPPS